MRPSYIFALLCAFQTCHFVDAHATSIVPTYPVTIEGEEYALLETKACIRTVGTKIQVLSAHRLEQGIEGTVYAQVECQSHGKTNGHPQVATAFCKRDSKWRCDSPQVAISMQLRGGKTLYSPPSGMDTTRAIRFVTFANSQAAFEGVAMSAILAGHCSLSPFRSRGIPPHAADYLINCTSGKVLLRETCYERRCKLSMVSTQIQGLE
jgi:hypothetical protein